MSKNTTSTVKRLFTISNILAVCSILLAVVKVKSLASLLPLAESDKIFYWTYLFLIIPNLLSFGLSIEVYKIYLDYKHSSFNKLAHKYILLLISGGVLSTAILYYLNIVPVFSLLGILAIIIITTNITVISTDTLVGLVKGPMRQQVLNLLRSNLWVVFIVPLILIFRQPEDYLTLFFGAYLFAQLIVIFYYKKAIGSIGKIEINQLKNLILELKDTKRYLKAVNNVLIQNKDYILGFATRTFIISRLNIPGLILLLSVFDIFITILTSFMNNEFLKNYGKENSNKENVAWIRLLLGLLIIPLTLINFFKDEFIQLLIGDKSHQLDSYVLYLSIYVFLRIIFISYNQLILLAGQKLSIWMSVFSLSYLVILYKGISPIYGFAIIFGMLFLDLMFVYFSFTKKLKYNFNK